MSQGVYLLHFDRPYEHARHYIGWSTDIEQRLVHHRQGRGARLLEVITGVGIGFSIARVWPGQTRTFERRLKRRGSAVRLCPTCSSRNGRGRWPEDLERADGHRPIPDGQNRCRAVYDGRPCRRRVYLTTRPSPHYRHLPRRRDPVIRLAVRIAERFAA